MNSIKKPLEGQLGIVLFFFHPRPKRLHRKKDLDRYIFKMTRPDIDNEIKLYFDALQGAEVFKDDGQIVSTIAFDLIEPKTIPTILLERGTIGVQIDIWTIEDEGPIEVLNTWAHFYRETRGAFVI